MVVAGDDVGEGGDHTQSGSGLQGERDEGRLGAPQTVCSMERIGMTCQGVGSSEQVPH